MCKSLWNCCIDKEQQNKTSTCIFSAEEVVFPKQSQADHGVSQEERLSFRQECQWLLKARYIFADEKWEVTLGVNELNHEMVKEVRMFHQHRTIRENPRPWWLIFESLCADSIWFCFAALYRYSNSRGFCTLLCSFKDFFFIFIAFFAESVHSAMLTRNAFGHGWCKEKSRAPWSWNKFRFHYLFIGTSVPWMSPKSHKTAMDAPTATENTGIHFQQD